MRDGSGPGLAAAAPRRSADEWSAIVKSFRASRMTAREYARQHGFKPSTLAWRSAEIARRERAEAVRARSTPKRPPFLPLVVRDLEAAGAARAKSADQIEIVLGELVLRLPVDTEVARIVALCRGLAEEAEEASC